MSRSSVKIWTWETGQQMDCNTKSTAKSVKENLTNADITKDEDPDLDKSEKNSMDRSWGFEKCSVKQLFKVYHCIALFNFKL